MQCPFGEGWAGALSLLFQRGRTTRMVGKRLQESRALAEGLVANLGEDGEGKPAALKHGDAARAALWRQVLLLTKIPQPMAGRMKAGVAKSAKQSNASRRQNRQSQSYRPKPCPRAGVQPQHSSPWWRLCCFFKF